jgi:biopolymer transport protein ExbD
MRIAIPAALLMLAIASNARAENVATTVEIKIEGEKTSYLIGGSPHTLDEITAALKAAGEGTPVVIKAAAPTPYEHVIAVMMAGAKVGAPTTFMNEAGEKIDMPAIKDPPPNPISVRIKMTEGKAVVTDGPLKAFEADEKRDLKTLFIIKPTKDVPYGELIKIVERIRKTGARSIGFAPPPR